MLFSNDLILSTPFNSDTLQTAHLKRLGRHVQLRPCDIFTEQARLRLWRPVMKHILCRVGLHNMCVLCMRVHVGDSQEGVIQGRGTKNQDIKDLNMPGNVLGALCASSLQSCTALKGRYSRPHFGGDRHEMQRSH